MTSFKTRLTNGSPLIGTIITLGLPAVAEMISACGFDWLWIDMEHAPLQLQEVQSLVQAKAAACAAFVRVPSNDEVWIKQVLDLGVDGIIVPQVKTGEEARRAVATAKYPPTGTRSVGLARAHKYGMQFANYVDEANDRTMVFLQIEHIDGVNNIHDILKVSGIDAVIIGPYDLSASMGKTGQLQDPEVQSAITKISAACREHHVPLGIFALQSKQGSTFLSNGYQLLAVGIDVHYLWSAAKASLDSVTALCEMSILQR